MIREWRVISDEESYPEPYSLVMVKHANHKSQVGWWTGSIWDGAYDIDQKTVKKWSPIAAKNAAYACEPALK